jgi:hypothetical protein
MPRRSQPLALSLVLLLQVLVTAARPASPPGDPPAPQVAVTFSTGFDVDIHASLLGFPSGTEFWLQTAADDSQIVSSSSVDAARATTLGARATVDHMIEELDAATAAHKTPDLIAGQPESRFDRRPATLSGGPTPGVDIAGDCNIPGDYDHDGNVDATDYLIWRDQLHREASPLYGAARSADFGDHATVKSRFDESTIRQAGPIAAAGPAALAVH